MVAWQDNKLTYFSTQENVLRACDDEKSDEDDDMEYRYEMIC